MTESDFFKKFEAAIKEATDFCSDETYSQNKRAHFFAWVALNFFGDIAIDGKWINEAQTKTFTCADCHFFQEGCCVYDKANKITKKSDDACDYGGKNVKKRFS